MKPVDSIPRNRTENPLQEKRREEVREFWEYGCEFAEMTIFNPDTRIQSEVQQYKKASRQLKLGSYKIDFTQRKGKIYAHRLVPAEEEA